MDIQKFLSSLQGGRQVTVKIAEFFIGRGVLKCDNFMIPLDAITKVSLTQRPKMPRFVGIILIVCGIILMPFPLGMIRAFGMISIIIGVVCLLLLNRINSNRECTLTVILNNNMVQTFASADKTFLLKVIQIIELCVNDRYGGYKINIGEQIINYIDDYSVGKIEAGRDVSNIQNRNVGGSTSGNVTVGDNSPITVNRRLSDDEWILLKSFFDEKMKTVNPASKNYQAYRQIKESVEEKNEKKLSDYMKKLGSKAIETVIVTGVGEAMKRQVLPILLGLIA